MACVQLPSVHLIDAHDLARDLHTEGRYFLVDCRPVLAFNSCHISGAVNVNFTVMMKKRFIAGKIGLQDLVTTEEGKKKFKVCVQNCLEWPTVVYDEGTSDVTRLSSSHAVLLVLSALEKMGKCPYLLQGGLSEFGVLHPSLCEISVPTITATVKVPNPTTPGVREKAMDWKTAPPVYVLSFLVLGSEKDAKSLEVMQEFKIKHVLNVTPKCPNHFEKEDLRYKRIAVSDTGSQKLSNYFLEAFQFIEEARKSGYCILIHCMAGISRSVTLTIAYLMSYFGMSMHSAYQFVKEKRPTISPNLNFMGQLVEFERELELNPLHDTLNVDDYLPTPEQERLSEMMRGASSSGSSAESTPEPNRVQDAVPFVLKLPAPKHKKTKTKTSPQSVAMDDVATTTTKLRPVTLDAQLSNTLCSVEATSSSTVPISTSSPWLPESRGSFSTSTSDRKSPILKDLEFSGTTKVEAKVKSYEKLSVKSRDVH